MKDWLSNCLQAKWKDGGREFPFLDCYGLARFIYKAQLNVDLPAYTDVSSLDPIEVAKRVQEEKLNWTRVPGGEEKQLDIVVLLHGGVPSHMGVVLQKGVMLHIERGRFASVERYGTGRWMGIEGLYRLSP